MQDLKQFAAQVERMRLAQVNYFQQIAKAKKTKLPGDFAAAANTLKISKSLEIEVDNSLVEIRIETDHRPTNPSPQPTKIW